MKKILVWLLLVMVCSCLHAEKQFNYRGIFPADRKADASITNYILLKKDTRVEFRLEEQGKGLTDLVKISAISSTSNPEIKYKTPDQDLSRLEVTETGIYQVTLVPSQPGGGEIRFVLVVKETAIANEEATKIASLAVSLPKPENPEPQISKAAASETQKTFESDVEADKTAAPSGQIPVKININQASLGRIETVEDIDTKVDAQEPQISATATIETATIETATLPNIEAAVTGPVNAVTTSTVAVAPHSSEKVKLLAPAEGFYLNPLNGFVFSLPAGLQPAEEQEQIKVSLLQADGSAKEALGQFFSARPGELTFLPQEMIPGAVYTVHLGDGSTLRRAVFPVVRAECEFLDQKNMIKLTWNQNESLMASPIGQKIRLDNALVSLIADEKTLVTLNPDQVAPYGVIENCRYFFRPYEMTFEISRNSESPVKNFELQVAARIDGQAEPVLVFQQSFSKDFQDAPAQPVSTLPDEPTTAEIVMLADLPENARFLLLQSFPAYEKEEEKNLSWPEELCWSESGDLWMIDSQIRRLLNFSADGRLKLAFGKKGDQPGQMSLPVALTLKQGRIYVADTAQHCLHKFAEDGSFLLQIKSDPSRGAIIDVPGGLCFRGDELWAVDRGLARVCCFDVEGKYLGGFGDHGIINSPLSVRSDDEGLFILEKNGIIKKFLPMGQQIAGFQTGCLEPRGFEVDPWGTIWVCDARQMQVVRFNQKGRVLATIKAPPGPRPWMPTGVAMRKDGMLAVSDAENKKIHIFSAESN